MNQLGRITAFFNEIKTNLGFSNKTKLRVRKTKAKVSRKASRKTVKAKTRTRVRTSKRKSVRKKTF